MRNESAFVKYTIPVYGQAQYTALEVRPATVDEVNEWRRST